MLLTDKDGARRERVIFELGGILFSRSHYVFFHSCTRSDALNISRSHAYERFYLQLPAQVYYRLYAPLLLYRYSLPSHRLRFNVYPSQVYSHTLHPNFLLPDPTLSPSPLVAFFKLTNTALKWASPCP